MTVPVPRGELLTKIQNVNEYGNRFKSSKEKLCVILRSLGMEIQREQMLHMVCEDEEDFLNGYYHDSCKNYDVVLKELRKMVFQGFRKLDNGDYEVDFHTDLPISDDCKIFGMYGA